MQLNDLDVIGSQTSGFVALVSSELGHLIADHVHHRALEASGGVGGESHGSKLHGLVLESVCLDEGFRGQNSSGSTFGLKIKTKN